MGGEELEASASQRQAELELLKDAAAISSPADAERSPSNAERSKSQGTLGTTGTTLLLSPRPRPLEAVQREEELRETFRKAEERSSWNPDFQSDESWHGRHQLAYCNDEMSQNCRCYFDRWLDHRELLPPDAALQSQKPTWRLEPDGVSPQQRRTERRANAIYSVTGPGLRPDAAKPAPIEPSTEELSKENVIKRRAMRVSRERPWELPPTPFFLSHKRSTSRTASITRSASTQTDFYGKERPNWVKEQDWDGHHHATWSNFQNLQGCILNPAPVRAYFDRPREPDVGARSAEKKPADPQDGVVRILPLWRLEPAPDTNCIEAADRRLWPRSEPLAPHSGQTLQKREEVLGIRHDASPEFQHKSTWSCPSLLTAAPSEELVERRQKWNFRHQLTFLNEEVSKLDRSYFDRFREHAALRDPSSPRHPDCSVWSLGKDLPTKDSARIILSNSEPRFRNDGKWMHRHQVVFDNAGGRLPVQRNLRCYFDRGRDFPSEAGAKSDDILPEDPSRGCYSFLTEASRSKMRCKLKDADKLKADVWSLTEKPSQQKAPIEETFRSCDDVPGSKALKEKRRSQWLSNHHVVF